MLLGNLGLHPIVASSVMVPVVVVGDFGVTDLVAVSTAVFAWGLNGGLSIWSLPMAMSAAYFGVPTPRLISRRGLLYVFVLGRRAARAGFSATARICSGSVEGHSRFSAAATAASSPRVQRKHACASRRGRTS